MLMQIVSRKIKELLSKIDLRIIILLLFILTVFSVIRRSYGLIQEDNYSGYAVAFEQNIQNLSYYDSRLFPGFPLVIYLFNIIFRNPLVSSYVVIFLSIIASYILFGKITKSRNNLILFLFPPIMLDVATKIANEYLTIFLILLTVYFFFNKKYSLSAFTAGLSVWVRPLGTLLFPAILASLFIYKKGKLKPKLFLSFFTPIAFFMLYNLYFFNTLSPFYQLFVYKDVSPYGNSIGFIQIFIDIYRTIILKDAKVFFSGVFYLGLLNFGFFKLFKNLTPLKNINGIFIYSSILFITLYVFVYSFNPFIENMARYMMPAYFLWWIQFRKDIGIPKYAYLLVPFSIAISIF
jgi:hypothetical protein